jgi:hypothetical protein
LDPGVILIESPWPGFEGNEISLNYLCNNANEFVTQLNLSDTGQIDNISQDLILKLFFDGEATLVCRLNEKHTLEFLYNNGTLYSTSNSSDLVETVEKTLKCPQDFIEHTKQYLSILKIDSARRN